MEYQEVKLLPFSNLKLVRGKRNDKKVVLRGKGSKHQHSEGSAYVVHPFINEFRNVSI